MTNKKMGKMVATTTVLGLLVGGNGVLLNQAKTENFAITQNQNQNEDENLEITKVKVEVKKEYLNIHGRTAFSDFNFDDYFIFKNQDDEIVDSNLLNIEYKIGEIASWNNGFDVETAFQKWFQKPFASIRSLYVSNISLKSDGSTVFKHAGSTLRVGLTAVNDAPKISVIEQNRTLYENAKYDEYKNVKITDFEDDRDDLKLQTNVEYSSNFNKDEMKKGEYEITYTVVDSFGEKARATELLTVVEAPKSIIKAQKLDFKYSNNEFDAIKDMKITSTDALDGENTDKIEVLSDNVNLKKEGVYEVKVKVVNEHKKETVETFIVNVKADNPTLESENQEIEFGSKFNILKDLSINAFDEVDEDLTDSVLVKSGSVDTSKVDKYKIVLEVTNSNNKKTEKVVFITVLEEVIEEPSTETTEEPTPVIDKPTQNTTDKTVLDVDKVLNDVDKKVKNSSSILENSKATKKAENNDKHKTLKEKESKKEVKKETVTETTEESTPAIDKNDENTTDKTVLDVDKVLNDVDKKAENNTSILKAKKSDKKAENDDKHKTLKKKESNQETNKETQLLKTGFASDNSKTLMGVVLSLFGLLGISLKRKKTQ